MHFDTLEEYLRELDLAQIDRQTDGVTNRMHKHFSILLESVKNHETQFKIRFQSFQSIAHHISENFCVILYMKHAFAHLNEIY